MLSCIIYNVTKNKRKQQHTYWLTFTGTSFQLILNSNNKSGFILYELLVYYLTPNNGNATYFNISLKLKNISGHFNGFELVQSHKIYQVILQDQYLL